MALHPVQIEGENRQSRWLVTCDHASNAIPEDLDGLGLPPAELERHIAYDIGAAGLARALGAQLDAPVVLSQFSRLVIDPNRGADDPTLLMRLYDGTPIPGNAYADDAELERRLDRYWRPYHAQVATLAARQPDTVIVAVHSFTPQLTGRALRPWHVGILSAHDRRLAEPVLAQLRAQPDIVVGDNEPYRGHLPGDAIDQHALSHGRQNVLLEVRQDLIATIEGQTAWADRFAPILTDALLEAETQPCPT